MKVRAAVVSAASVGLACMTSGQGTVLLEFDGTVTESRTTTVNGIPVCVNAPAAVGERFRVSYEIAASRIIKNPLNGGWLDESADIKVQILDDQGQPTQGFDFVLDGDSWNNVPGPSRVDANDLSMISNPSGDRVALTSTEAGIASNQRWLFIAAVASTPGISFPSDGSDLYDSLALADLCGTAVSRGTDYMGSEFVFTAQEEDPALIGFGTECFWLRGTVDEFSIVCIDDCPADVNGDGLATPADFNAWILAFNSNAPACDQNGDGLCNPSDFNAWVLNFNAGC